MLDYYLINYVDDLYSPVERSICIIAHDGVQVHLRLLGAQSRDQVDTAPFAAISENAPANVWVYREWVDWFYDVSENEGVNPAGFHKVMGRLMSNGTSITVVPGTSEVPDGTEPALLVDQLYASNV